MKGASSMPGRKRRQWKSGHQAKKCFVPYCPRMGTELCEYTSGNFGRHFACPDHMLAGLDMYGRQFCSIDHQQKRAKEDPA